MERKRLDCLEGLRALACIGVVLCHLKGAFFPNSGLAALLHRTPVKYMFNGNTPVRIMFILSGFVLCYKYFNTGRTGSLQRDTVKRYFRLMIPTLVITLIVYVMMKFNLLWNAQAAPLTDSVEFLGIFNQFEPQLKSALKDSLWGCLFGYGSGYVGPLWTMTYEMLGSYLVFAVVAIIKSRRVRYVFYILYLLIFPAYYIYFILGMMICDIYTGEERLNEFLKAHPVLTVALHAAAWCYISMVSGLDDYRWKLLVFDAAAAVMFLTLLNNPILDKIWGNKAAVTVGKHGFSIYLVHWPIIESFSCVYLLTLTKLGYGHRMIVFSDILLSIILIYAVSVCFTKLVVLPGNRLSDKITDLIIGEKSR